MIGMHGIRDACKGVRKALATSMTLGLLLLSSPAHPQDPGADTSAGGGDGKKGRIECVHGLDLKSRYVTMRGISYSDGPVLQPYGNYRWKDFALTNWYDLEPGKARPLKEMDIDLHYKHGIGGNLNAKTGFMEAYLPYEDFLFLHSLYGELGWEGPVNLSCYVDRDWYDNDSGWLGKIKAEKDFLLGRKINLGLALEMTYNRGDFKPISDFSHASVSGSLSLDIGRYKLKVNGYYQEPLNRHFGRQSWIGVGISR